MRTTLYFILAFVCGALALLFIYPPTGLRFVSNAGVPQLTAYRGHQYLFSPTNQKYGVHSSVRDEDVGLEGYIAWEQLGLESLTIIALGGLAASVVLFLHRFIGEERLKSAWARFALRVRRGAKALAKIFIFTVCGFGIFFLILLNVAIFLEKRNKENQLMEEQERIRTSSIRAAQRREQLQRKSELLKQEELKRSEDEGKRREIFRQRCDELEQQRTQIQSGIHSSPYRSEQEAQQEIEKLERALTNCRDADVRKLIQSDIEKCNRTLGLWKTLHELDVELESIFENAKATENPQRSLFDDDPYLHPELVPTPTPLAIEPMPNL